MGRSSLVGLLCAAIVVVGCNSGPSSQQAAEATSGKGVLVRVHPKVGQKFNLVTTMDLSSASQSGKLTIEAMREVKSVTDTLTTFSDTVVSSKGEGIFAGIEANIPKTPAETTLSDRGDAGGSGMSGIGQTSFRPFYPEKEVKVGDTWSGDFISGGQTMKGQYKAEAVEKVGAYEAIKIKGDMTGAMNGSVTVWIDLESGIPVKLDMDLSGTTGGQAGTLKMHTEAK